MGQPNQASSPEPAFPSFGCTPSQSASDRFDPFDHQLPTYAYASAFRVPALEFLEKGYDLNVGLGLPSANKDRFSPKDFSHARKLFVAKRSEADFSW